MFRWILVLAGIGFVALLLFLIAWVEPRARVTRHSEPLAQPMWFDHRHHVTGFGIDCRYCHFAVERSPTAGLPATEVCVPCHEPVWLESPYFEPVRRSLETGMPLAWQRAHDLPDFVFFDHSIHVNKGVGCESCHGRVDRMARVRQVAPLTMAWCLDCHRSPERHLRPLEHVTTMGWRPDTAREALAARLARRYDIRSGRPITTCTACHR